MAFNIPLPRPNENYASYMRRLMPELNFALNSLEAENEKLKTANETLTRTVAQLTDTGWRKLNADISYRCKNGFVTVVGNSTATSLTQNDYKLVGTIPAVYQPSIRTAVVFSGVGGTMDGQSGFIEINGEINLYTAEANKTHWAFTVTYSMK